MGPAHTHTHTHTHSLCTHTQTLPLSTSKGPTWVSGLEFHPLRLGPSHAHSETRSGRSLGPGPGWGAQQCRSAGAGSSQGPESLEKEGGKRKRDREDPEVTGAEARGRGHVGSAVRGATSEAASHPQARDGTAVLRRGRRWLHRKVSDQVPEDKAATGGNVALPASRPRGPRGNTAHDNHPPPKHPLPRKAHYVPITGTPACASARPVTTSFPLGNPSSLLPTLRNPFCFQEPCFLRALGPLGWRPCLSGPRVR